jgi:hypothetical protein
MEELLKELETAPAPTYPLRINVFMTVTGPVFVESCKRMHEKGDTQAVRLMTDYLDALVKGPWTVARLATPTVQE